MENLVIKMVRSTWWRIKSWSWYTVNNGESTHVEEGSRSKSWWINEVSVNHGEWRRVVITVKQRESSHVVGAINHGESSHEVGTVNHEESSHEVDT